MGGSKNGKFLSTEPVKVEEAETVDVPPPTSEKLLVLSGNGFVGSNISREASYGIGTHNYFSQATF